MLVKIWILMLLLGYFGVVDSSRGDRDMLYHQCLNDCDCPRSIPSAKEFYIFYPSWSCFDNCEYSCMHQITELRVKHGYSPLKYYGHWPFKRYFDLEEPASVIFSSANAIPHVFHFLSYIKNHFFPATIHTRNRMTNWLFLYSISGSIAWILSSVFHSRKTEFTTLLDYISALIFLSLSLWLAFNRVFGHFMNDLFRGVILMVFTGGLIAWIWYMTQHPLDFGLHMYICIAIAMLQNVIWYYWSILSTERKFVPTIQKVLCLLCQIWFSVAAALEIFDFAPYWGIFDAHSLWHLATIPLGFIWYYFWKLDAQHLSSSAVSDPISDNNIRQKSE